MAKTKKEEALTKPAETALATSDFDFGDDCRDGFEDQTSEDIMVPMVNLLQSNSPDVGDEKAKAGQFRIGPDEYVDSFIFIGVKPVRVCVEWVPRDDGGGLVAVHAIDSELVKNVKETSNNRFGPWKVNGNELVETLYLYGLHWDQDLDVFSPMVLPFVSTKFKSWRQWNTRVSKHLQKTGRTLPNGLPETTQCPLYAFPCKVSSEKLKKDSYTFYSYRLESVTKDLSESVLGRSHPSYAHAKSMKKMVEDGLLQVKDDSRAHEDAELVEEAPF